MRHLYALPFPDEMTNVDRGDESTAQQALASDGLLTQDGRSVEQVALDESDLHVQGLWRFGEDISTRVAAELESLSESSFGELAFYADEGDTHDGFYEIASADVTSHPVSKAIRRFDLRLTKAGTHESHWRAVRLTETDADNPFANDTTDTIAVDARATQVRWFSRGAGTASAEPVSTQRQQFGYTRHFDASQASFEPEYLLFELPFSREGVTDPVVWDPRDRPKQLSLHDADYQVGDATVGDATVGRTTRATQWIHVFNTDYEFSQPGVKVLENGRIRLRFDEDKQILQASEWQNGRFVPIPLDHSDFLLYDISLERIGPARIDAYCEFEAIADGSTDAVALSLQRGHERPILTLPDNQASIPTELHDMLDPIASDASTAYEPRQTLVPRTEVSE